MDVSWTILHVLMLIILEDDRNNVTSEATRDDDDVLLNEWMNIYVLDYYFLSYVDNIKCRKMKV